MKAVREIDERGEDAVAAAAEILNLPADRLRAALRYYGANREEIDAEIAQADEDSRAAEEGWRAEQRLLA